MDDECRFDLRNKRAGYSEGAGPGDGPACSDLDYHDTASPGVPATGCLRMRDALLDAMCILSPLPRGRGSG